MRLRSKVNLDGEKKGGAGSQRKKIRDGGVKKTFKQDGPGERRLLRSSLQNEISEDVVAVLKEAKGGKKVKSETEACKKRLRSCPQNEIAATLVAEVEEAKEGKTEACKKRPAAQNKPRSKEKARGVKRTAPSCQDRDSPPPKRASSPRQSTSKLTSEKDTSKPASEKDTSKLTGEKDTSKLTSEKDTSKLTSEKDTSKLTSEKDTFKITSEKDTYKITSEKDTSKLASEKDTSKLTSEKDPSKLTSEKEGRRKRLLRSCSQHEIAATLVAGVEEALEGTPEACKKRPAAENKPRGKGKARSVKRTAPSCQDRDSPPPKRASPPRQSTSKIDTEKGSVDEGQTAPSSGPIKRRRRRRGKIGFAGAVSVQKSNPPVSAVPVVFLVEAPKDGRITRNVIVAPPLSSPSLPLSMPLLNADSESDHQPAPENRPPLGETDISAPPSATGYGSPLDLSQMKSRKEHVLESQMSKISFENNEMDKSNLVNESETLENHKEEINHCTSQVLKSTIGQTTNSPSNDNICELEKNSQVPSTKIPHVSDFNSSVTSFDMIENYDRTNCLQCSSSFSGDGDDILVENCPLASETASNNNISCYPETTCDELPSSIESITEDIGFPRDIDKNVDAFLQEIIPRELKTVSKESSKDSIGAVRPAKIQGDKVMRRAPLYCESSVSMAPVEVPKEFQNLLIISESDQLSNTNEITDISGSAYKKVEGSLKQFGIDLDEAVKVSGVQNITNSRTSPDKEMVPHQSPDEPHDNDWDFKRFPSSAGRKNSAIIDDSPEAITIGEEKFEPFKIREKEDNIKRVEKVRPKNKKKTSSGAKESVFPLASPVDKKNATIASSSPPSQDPEKPSTSITLSKEKKDKVKPKTCADKDVPNKLPTAQTHSDIKHMKSGPRAKFSVVSSSKHSLSDIKASDKEPKEKWKIVHSDIPLTKSSLANSVPKPDHGIKMKFIKSSQSSQRETIESRPENKLVTSSKDSPSTTMSKSCPDNKFEKLSKKKKIEEVPKVSVTADKVEITTKTSPLRQKEINKPSSGPKKKSVAEIVSFLEESIDSTPSNSSPDKELRLKDLKPMPRKKKTEEVAKTVKKAEPVKDKAPKDSSPAIEKKSSHAFHKTTFKDKIEVSKKSSMQTISHLPTLKDNDHKSTDEKPSSSSSGKRPFKVSNPCETSVNRECAPSSSSTESVSMASNSCHCEELSHNESATSLSFPEVSESNQVDATPYRSDSQPRSNSSGDAAKSIKTVTSTSSCSYSGKGVHNAEYKGVCLPQPLSLYCRGRLLRNSCRRNHCNWKHEFTPEFFCKLSPSDLQYLIKEVLREAVEVSSSFIWAALGFFLSRQMKTQILWLAGEFLKKELRTSSIRCEQYFIKMSGFFFSALNSCGIQRPLERREIIEANKGFFESLSNEAINSVLNCWGINSLKPILPVIEPLTEMEGFVFSDFLLAEVYVEIMANPNKKAMEIYGNQLLKLKPDRQRFFADPSRHYIIRNFIENLVEFGLEFLSEVLTLKYSNILSIYQNHNGRSETLDLLLSEAEECFFLAIQTRQWQSSIDFLIETINSYKGNSRVEKELLKVIFKVFNRYEPLMNMKDFLYNTWAVRERVFVHNSFFGTLIYLFMAHFSRNRCWPVALGFYELLNELSISLDSIMDMEEEPSTPLSRAMLISEVLFRTECWELLVKFITSPNGLTHLSPETYKDDNLNTKKSFDLLHNYLKYLINSGEIHKALALFRFILDKQKCNKPISLSKFFEVIITQLIEKNGLTEELLTLYSDLDSALDGQVFPSCLYLRTLLITALKFKKPDLIIDLFQKCITAGSYPTIGLEPYTIYLLMSMTQDEMMMYIIEWIVQFRSYCLVGLRPPNAKPSEDGQRPQAAYEIDIIFSPNHLSAYYDASSPPVILNVLSQVNESLEACALRVQAALQILGLSLRSTQPPLYLDSRLFEKMWGYRRLG